MMGGVEPALVKEAVEAYGKHMMVESQLDAGSLHRNPAYHHGGFAGVGDGGY
jgi:hypothetical protein